MSRIGERLFRSLSIKPVIPAAKPKLGQSDVGFQGVRTDYMCWKAHRPLWCEGKRFKRIQNVGISEAALMPMSTAKSSVACSR
jgi:hypothetical protein